jgi:hypothetical protein
MVFKIDLNGIDFKPGRCQVDPDPDDYFHPLKKLVT